MRGTTAAEEAEEWPLLLMEWSESALLRGPITQQERLHYRLHISESDQFSGQWTTNSKWKRIKLASWTTVMHYIVITTTHSFLLNPIDVLGPWYKSMITLTSLVNKLGDRNNNHAAAAAGSLGFLSDYRVLLMWAETEGTWTNQQLWYLNNPKILTNNLPKTICLWITMLMCQNKHTVSTFLQLNGHNMTH